MEKLNFIIEKLNLKMLKLKNPRKSSCGLAWIDALKNALIIIIGDVLNTEFDTSDKRHFGAQTAVSNMENLACPDWSVHGE